LWSRSVPDDKADLGTDDKAGLGTGLAAAQASHGR